MIEIVTFESKDKRDLDDARAAKHLNEVESKLSRKWGSPPRLVRVRFIDDSRPADEWAKLPAVKRFVIESVWQAEASRA